jgi:polyribonucleotide nucleotidyltransferase
MDFKVAGTRNGVNAIQMDIKTDGIPLHILSEALEQAKIARLQILDVIEKEIAAPRADISPNAPKILIMKIRVDQIGGVIGTGGKVINEIKEKTGAEIMIEDDGTVYITGKNGAAEKALAVVEALTHEFKVGETFDGVVTKIAEFGAFVKLTGGTEGLVHISELAPFRVDKVGDLVKEGQVLPVIIKSVEVERNRIALSVKDRDPNFFKNPSK